MIRRAWRRAATLNASPGSRNLRLLVLLVVAIAVVSAAYVSTQSHQGALHVVPTLRYGESLGGAGQPESPVRPDILRGNYHQPPSLPLRPLFEPSPQQSPSARFGDAFSEPRLLWSYEKHVAAGPLAIRPGDSIYSKDPPCQFTPVTPRPPCPAPDQAGPAGISASLNDGILRATCTDASVRPQYTDDYHGDLRWREMPVSGHVEVAQPFAIVRCDARAECAAQVSAWRERYAEWMRTEMNKDRCNLDATGPHPCPGVDVMLTQGVVNERAVTRATAYRMSDAKRGTPAAATHAAAAAPAGSSQTASASLPPLGTSDDHRLRDLNFIMVFADSASRPTVAGTYRETADVLRELALINDASGNDEGASHRRSGHATFAYPFYNLVGHGTTSRFYAGAFGGQQQLGYDPDDFADESYHAWADRVPWVWNEFRKRGYAALAAHSAAFTKEMQAFHWDRYCQVTPHDQTHTTGRVVPGTAEALYYARLSDSHLLDGFQQSRDPTKRYRRGQTAYSIDMASEFVCVADKREAQWYGEWLRKTTEAYNARGVPVWANLHSHYAHARYAGCPGLSMHDPDVALLVRDLHASGTLNRTVLVFVADHGRHGSSFNPHLSITVPHWVLRQYPDVAEGLRANQRQVVTMFDIYSTALNVLSHPEGPETLELGGFDIAASDESMHPGHPDRPPTLTTSPPGGAWPGKSLLRAMPYEQGGRTCADAGVDPEPWACITSVVEDVTPADELWTSGKVLAAAKASIAVANERTAAMRDDPCREMVVTDVVSAQRFRDPSAECPTGLAVRFQVSGVGGPAERRALFLGHLCKLPSDDKGAGAEVREVTPLSRWAPNEKCVPYGLDTPTKMACMTRCGDEESE